MQRMWKVQGLQFHRGTRFQPFQACVSRVDSSEAPNPSGNSIPTIPSLCIECGQFRGSNSIGELDLNPPRLCIACQRFESMRFPVSVSDRHRFNFGETFTALDPSECNGCGKFRGPKSIGELDSNLSKPVNRMWTVQSPQIHRGTRFQPFQACVSSVDSSEAPIPSGNSI